jgi:hypothetical protein
MNPMQAPPLEVIDLIDLDMEDSEVPIPTILAQQDTWPELMPVVLFIIPDTNNMFNGINYIYMGQGYYEQCIDNVAIGLQPPIGTLSFPGGANNI